MEQVEEFKHLGRCSRRAITTVERANSGGKNIGLRAVDRGVGQKEHDVGVERQRLPQGRQAVGAAGCDQFPNHRSRHCRRDRGTKFIYEEARRLAALPRLRIERIAISDEPGDIGNRVVQQQVRPDAWPTLERELDQGHIKEFIAAAGVGLTSQYLEQFGRKLLGGLFGGVAGKMGRGLGGAATGMAFSSGRWGKIILWASGIGATSAVRDNWS